MANLILFGAVLLCIEFNIAVSITIGLTVVTLFCFGCAVYFQKIFDEIRCEMRLAVIGANGFVGRALCPLLNSRVIMYWHWFVALKQGPPM